jgi:hypothetical protein
MWNIQNNLPRTKGRNVGLEKKFGAPQIVNHGITIAKEIELEDHVENTGVSFIYLEGIRLPNDRSF